MNSILHSKAWGCLLGLAVISISATAQTSATSPSTTVTQNISLSEALESAWQRHPWLQSEANRRAELAGRKLQTQGLTSAAPTIGLAHSTDRIGSNNGLRGLEVEISAPLWNAGLRSATQSQIERDEQRFLLSGQAAKLKLAGELRELAARFALAQSDQQLAKRKVSEAISLADDVAKRVRVGDVARVDNLMAQSAVTLAQGQLEAAQSELVALQSQWQTLTGLTTTPAPLRNASSAQTSDLSNHPQLQEAQATVTAVQAKLATTLADSRDPMEVGITATRERSARGSPNETSMQFAVRIPLGSASRNTAKAAAARAELDEAQNALQVTERQLQAEQSTARAQVASAQRALALAEQRAKLATEAQSLYAKAYRLGESDLTTRLRADNEKFDADLALSRAQLQLQRAQSQLQHSLGLLP
ncbi:TolC family protein [Variovorax sp. PCZ-1]|uniref:TolC family protein n=1 Tax=Variovorax sp. PCZ-1 TaxID=2835533 RepID=UPI001BCAE34C|nr:TolC family protein [Variovorax sp. PCZ-1]MBS7807965.1 TolC family protein [Variovorax sp. PCZ-1]